MNLNKFYKFYLPLGLAAILIVGSVGYWQYRNPLRVFALPACSGTTSVSLDQGTYTYNVNDTFNVIVSTVGSLNNCNVAVFYFPIATWIAVPAIATDLSCNGSANCILTTQSSPNANVTFTLKCIAVGTYTIRGQTATGGVVSFSSTVTCSSGGGTTAKSQIIILQ